MKDVSVRENSWIARLAARKLGFRYIAIVIGKTIYLHNTKAANFVESKRWLRHELKHVEQFEQYGFFKFVYKYFIEYLKNGYHQNKFEVEAREAEQEDGLILRYRISTNIK